MSAGRIFFSLNSTDAAFWRAGASVRVAARADSAQRQAHESGRNPQRQPALPALRDTSPA